MIFVSVGTHEAPFDRMLQTVFDLGLDEELVVQYGPSAVRSDRATTQVEYLDFDEVVRNIREARGVVMHAGVGSVMISLANGKRPIVMARRAEFGEHVDDADALAAALAADAQAPGRMSGVPWLGEDLGGYLAEQLGTPRSSPAPSY